MYLPATGTRRRLRPGMRGLGAASLSLSQIQQMITASAQQYGVDPSLALAIAQQESSFNPTAVSQPNRNGTVDYGLMQINSSNLSSMGLTPSSALDPQANINAAMQLLAGYSTQYGGDPTAIANAYNAGPAGTAPQSYISSVLSNMLNFGSSGAPVAGGLPDLSQIDTSAGVIDPTYILYGVLGLLGVVLIAEVI